MQVKLKPEDEARAGRVRAAVGARSVAELVRVALAILEAGVVAPAGPCGPMAEAARGVVRRGARGVVGVQAAVAEAVGGVYRGVGGLAGGAGGARLDVRKGMREGCHACMEISATGHANGLEHACAGAQEVDRG